MRQLLHQPSLPRVQCRPQIRQQLLNRAAQRASTTHAMRAKCARITCIAVGRTILGSMTLTLKVKTMSSGQERELVFFVLISVYCAKVWCFCVLRFIQSYTAEMSKLLGPNVRCNNPGVHRQTRPTSRASRAKHASLLCQGRAASMQTQLCVKT